MSKKPKATVLREQKLSRRRRFKFKKPLVWALVGTSVFAFTFFLYSHFSQPTRSTIDTPTQIGKPKHWQLDFSSASLSEQTKKEISKVLDKNLASGAQDQLTSAAKVLQRHFDAELVSLIRTEKEKLSVGLTFRKPVLRIRCDRQRLVATNGKIYGRAESLASSDSLPLLSGIFSERNTPFVFQEDSTIAVSPEEEELVKDALTLFGQSKEHGLDIASIEYVKYRGFLIKNKVDDIEISMGLAPFNDQFRQLSEILKDLKKSSSQALRIELDYKGKAFIKEKEM